LKDLKKKILIVSVKEKPALFLKKILLDVLFNEIVIDIFSFKENEIEELNFLLNQKTHLILASGDISFKKVQHYASNFKIIKASRDVSEPEFFDRLFLIPEKKNVLVVNETKSGTLETIDSLKNLGLNHINYIPYWLNCNTDYSEIDTAVSPGMLNLCPTEITNKIDIGMRKLSVPCFVKILKLLNLNINYLEPYVNRQKEILIKTYKKLSNEFIRAEKLKNSLKSIINGLEEAIISVDNEYIITDFNFSAEKLLKCNTKEILNNKIYEVFNEIENAKEFFVKKEKLNNILILDNKQFYVNYLPIYANKKISGGIYTFKEVKEIQKKEENVRRILYKGTYEYEAKYTFNNIFINSTKMKSLRDNAISLSNSDSTILITGESGTGKELFAQSIHNMSNRKDGPFVGVNFAAINDNLIESELFGYEEGAFTGAKKSGKKGLFELAHNGTIFLDEIGDSSLWVQSRLLRVLEEKEIMRLGDTKIIPVNVRVIVATNKDLKSLIEESKFREDLYYRLNVFKLRIPPLRERREDILPSVKYFMDIYNIKKTLTKEAQNYIYNYNWPGNIRELKNMVEYFSIKSKHTKIDIDDLPYDIMSNYELKKSNFESDITLNEKLQSYNQDLIKYILEITYSNKNNHSTIGRKRMKSILNKKGLKITDSKLRTLLKHLESYNLVDVGITKQGTIITDKGEFFLKNI